MTENLVRFGMLFPCCARRSVIVHIVCAACVLSGCSMRKQPAIPWATAISVRPVTQARSVEANSDREDPPPELRFELPPFPGTLTTARSAPPRPRGNNTPPAVTPENNGEKFGTTMISPQLTPQESAVAQQQANQRLGIADKKLPSRRGKNVNSTQSELISKITRLIKAP